MRVMNGGRHKLRIQHSEQSQKQESLENIPSIYIN